MKLSHKENAISAPTFRGFRDESVRRVLSHVFFELNDLIWEEKGRRSEAEFLRKEPLQATQNHTEDIFSRKMLTIGVQATHLTSMSG